MSKFGDMAALSEFYSPIPSGKNTALHFLADVHCWIVWGLFYEVFPKRK